MNDPQFENFIRICRSEAWGSSRFDIAPRAEASSSSHSLVNIEIVFFKVWGLGPRCNNHRPCYKNKIEFFNLQPGNRLFLISARQAGPRVNWTRMIYFRFFKSSKSRQKWCLFFFFLRLAEIIDKNNGSQFISFFLDWLFLHLIFFFFYNIR